MRTRVVALYLGLGLVLAACAERDSPSLHSTSAALTLPSGFIEESIGGTWNQAVGLTFTADGQLLVWEKAGRVWRVEANGTRAATPLLDIHEEVGDWRDYGMLGLALHPNFLSNGYFYVLYSVDYHHLRRFGTPAYDPDADEYFVDTQTRVTRYQARASDGFRSVDPASRKVLLGEAMGSGCPLNHESHGPGSLVFAQDGTLLITCGDGASYNEVDDGGPLSGRSYTALSDGIITQAEDVGAFRPQLVDSLAGKVLRIDPATGDGVPSNPFYDAGAARSARSRVWALGLRNPFRAALRPDSGSHDPEDGDPGTLYVGDVGWDEREELNVITGPGQNLGWPLYEGMTPTPGYPSTGTLNRNAPNPLFGTTPPGRPPCTQAYFRFSELLVQDTTATPSFPNGCDPAQQIPAALRRFEHSRPVIDWAHGSGIARVPTYTPGGAASTVNLGAAGAPVSGAGFGGNSAMGGVWYTGSDFPETYRGTFFMTDFDAGWVKNLVFDAQDRLQQVRDFAPAGASAIVALATNPVDGGLYYVSYATIVRRIRYVGGGNRPPLAAASADVRHGASPLQVQFTGSTSRDPELGPLSFDWDFGDASPHSNQANPLHTFDSGDAAPHTYQVTLRVTDVAGAVATASVQIVVNNAPPSVLLVSPVNGDVFALDANSTEVLMAAPSDGEQSAEALGCQWQVALHHNNHSHPEPLVSGCMQSAQITPVACDDEDYYYAFAVTVDDGAGLRTSATSVLYPDCAPGALEPQGIAVSTTPTFVWRRVQGADRYEILVHDSAQQAAVQAEFSPAQVGCAAGPRCSLPSPIALALGDASFQVRSRNPVAGWRGWSDVASFAVQNMPPPPPPPPSGTNLASIGTPTVSVTAPLGGGSRNLGLIRDGVKPPVGSSSDALQYDTYRGTAASTGWVGYTFASAQSFASVVFQEGKHFGDGGWFETLTVQVRQAGTWVAVTGQSITPAYAGSNGVNYESYTLTFNAISGDGIRIFGAPGGSADFFSVAELEVYASDGPAPPPPPNSPPTANAGPDQTVASAQLVTLSALASTDPEGNALSYSWTQSGAPPVTLSSATAAQPTFTAPTVTVTTTLTFALVVNDGTASSVQDTVSVQVTPPSPPPPVNTPPTANAGPDQTVASAQLVTLTALGSTDPEGNALSYSWTQSGAPAVTLSSATAAQPTFTAPTVTVTTTLTFALVVNDGTASSAQDSVSVQVTPPPPPPTGTNLALTGTPTASVTAPLGGGSRNLGLIRDGVKPPVGSSSDALQYDTYRGTAASTGWVGYTFTSTQSFGRVVFQEGRHFGDGGWFETLTVQVRQGGTWVAVTGLNITPAYPGSNNGVSYESYTLTFNAISGNGIRIFGAPGGSADFFSVAELEVFAGP